jgi:hypothetical protein
MNDCLHTHASEGNISRAFDDESASQRWHPHRPATVTHTQERDQQ